MDRNASPMTIAWIDSCSGNNDLLCWAGGMRFPADGSHQNHSYPSWWRKGSVSMGLLNTSSVPGSWSAVLFVLVVCSLVRLGSLGTKEKCSRRNLCSAKKRGAVASWGPLQGDPRASIPAAHCWSCRARRQGPMHTIPDCTCSDATVLLKFALRRSGFSQQLSLCFKICHSCLVPGPSTLYSASVSR